MNLNAYDKIYYKTDKTKTWIDTKRGILLSREINKRNYYTFLKRYEPELRITNYYLVVLDDNPRDRQVFRIKVDDYGRLKFNISKIANECGLINVPNGNNVKLVHIEHTDDGDIYKFDL